MMEQRSIPTREEAARLVRLDVAVVAYYADCGLIQPEAGYSEEDLAELRRARRLQHELGLTPEATEIVLRLRRQVLALQRQVQELERHVRYQPRRSWPEQWVDVLWEE